MHTPKTKTLFFFGVGLFILTTISIPPCYPAAVPVMSSDGSLIAGPDGKLLVHRDMASYWRYVLPGLLFLAGSISLFGWWLTRVLRLIYKRVAGV